MSETPRVDEYKKFLPLNNPWECFSLMTKKARELELEVKELTGIFELQRKREQPWIERWRQETGKELSVPDYGEMLNWIMDKAEKAERELENLEHHKTEIRY